MWGVEKAYLGGLFAERVCGSCWTTCTQSRGVWDRCRLRLWELPYAFYPLTSRPSPLWMKTCGHLLSRSSLRLGKILSHSPWTCVWRLSHHRGGSHLQRNQVRHGVVSINRDDWEMLVLAYAHRCRFFAPCACCGRAHPKLLLYNTYHLLLHLWRVLRAQRSFVSWFCKLEQAK